ncbi:hypothetical protein KPL74_01730 [Bacillus sp. NP157]|nr:hypothetical protein KPL74_01730 [Bacillus sp. NP157]
MSKFTTIKSFRSALGGESWRATSDGQTVHIQSRTGATWRTRRAMDAGSFETYADRVGLYDPYNDDPAKLAHLAHA